MGDLKSKLIIAEVGKQEYGDEEGKMLHERYSIDKDSWPVYVPPRGTSSRVGIQIRFPPVFGCIFSWSYLLRSRYKLFPAGGPVFSLSFFCDFQ